MLIEPPNGRFYRGVDTLDDNGGRVGDGLKRILKSGRQCVGGVVVSLLCRARELHDGVVWSKDSDGDNVRRGGRGDARNAPKLFKVSFVEAFPNRIRFADTKIVDGFDTVLLDVGGFFEAVHVVGANWSLRGRAQFDDLFVGEVLEMDDNRPGELAFSKEIVENAYGIVPEVRKSVSLSQSWSQERLQTNTRVRNQSPISPITIVCSCVAFFTYQRSGTELYSSHNSPPDDGTAAAKWSRIVSYGLAAKYVHRGMFT